MKKSPRVLLLIDWLPEQGSLLFDSLRKNGLDCDIMGINFHQSKWTPVNKILTHWPQSFRVSLKAFRLRHDYDCVIAWQQVMGMFLGLFKLFSFSNSPKIFILVATIVERNNFLLEKLRRCFIALSYKKINHIGFISSAYARLIQERFKLPQTKVVHLNLPLDFKENPEFSGFKAGSYLYSMGLSYRDYPTLLKAARMTSKQFVIATLAPYLKDLEIPANVTIYSNAFGQTADELMEHSAAVILPLDRIDSPAGETVLLRTMCYGKPVIVTRTITTEEYIDDGKNGLLVPWKDPEAIVEAINRIFSDPDKANEMGRQARRYVLENHSMDLYAKKIAHIIHASVPQTG